MDKNLVVVAGKEFGEAIAQRINEVRASHGDKIALMTNEIVREILTHSVILSSVPHPENRAVLEQMLSNRLFNFTVLVTRAYSADEPTAYTALKKAIELSKQLREYLDVLATDVTVDEELKRAK